jgi:plastocyanin
MNLSTRLDVHKPHALRWLAGTACAATISGSMAAASLTVQVMDSAGKPLADAAVFLESKEARAAAKPGREVAVEQVALQFKPRMSIVTTGTAVSFPNHDKVRHHVYSFSPVKNFELKLYTGTPATPVVFDRSGIALLGCNIHDNMTAWVVVVDTPYFGRTGADGRVALEGVPRGSYQLRTWHTSQPVGAPASEQTVAVADSNPPVTVQLKDAKP